MAYMKKNVNMGLLLLLVAVIICFAAFTAYYQKTFTNLSISYVNKVERIENLVGSLKKQSDILSQTSRTLNTTSAEREVLGERYTTLQSEKEVVEDELTGTKQELNDKIASINALNLQISELNSRIDSLIDDVNDLKGDYNSLCETHVTLGGSCTKK